MDEFFLGLVNDGDMLLMNVFLVDDRLDVLVYHVLMVLMDNIFVNFFNYVLVMLMDYVSMRLFDDWLLDNSLNNGCLSMWDNLTENLVWSEHWFLFMPDHSWGLTELLSS